MLGFIHTSDGRHSFAVELQEHAFFVNYFRSISHVPVVLRAFASSLALSLIRYPFSLLELHLLRSGIDAIERLPPNHRAARRTAHARTFLEYTKALIAHLRHVDTLAGLEAPGAKVDVVLPREVHPPAHGRRGEEDRK